MPAQSPSSSASRGKRPARPRGPELAVIAGGIVLLGAVLAVRVLLWPH